MGASGNVWELIDFTATKAAPQGQYYVEVTPAGQQTLYPLALPRPIRSYQLIPTGPSVISSDGAVWCEESYPDLGYLLRFAPG